LKKKKSGVTGLIKKIVVRVEDESLIKSGLVKEVYRNVRFVVHLDEGGVVDCVLSGKMRRFRINVVVGDKVKIIVSKNNSSFGRIIRRF